MQIVVWINKIRESPHGFPRFYRRRLTSMWRLSSPAVTLTLLNFIIQEQIATTVLCIKKTTITTKTEAIINPKIFRLVSHVVATLKNSTKFIPPFDIKIIKSLVAGIRMLQLGRNYTTKQNESKEEGNEANMWLALGFCAGIGILITGDPECLYILAIGAIVEMFEKFL